MTADKLPSREQSGDVEDVSFSDAAELGFKVIEMADRVSTMDACLPGSQARWHFEMDDRRFVVTVAPAREAAHADG